MDLQQFERIEASFRQFHAELAPAFGRQQWRERSRDYLRGLLVPAAERGNAENRAEAVEGASARVLHRFSTEARWDDPAVTPGDAEAPAGRGTVAAATLDKRGVAGVAGGHPTAE